VAAEGGGLLWRISAGGNAAAPEPAAPVSVFDDKGAALLWPMKEAGNILTLDDPDFGDTLTIVPVKAAGGGRGNARSYVELSTLNSAAGLVIAPKVDDLKITTPASGVRAARPGTGLALSRPEDIKPLQIRQDAGSEEAAPPAQAPPAQPQSVETPQKPEEKAELQTPAGDGSASSRLYHFARWEMGGGEALEENLRILAADMGPKDANGRAADLITMARLNLSNGRAEEALGQLRLAADLVPGIAEGAEYLSLRAAGNALAWRYEDAIADFATPGLKDYPETAYWKAFTLAGLEDWQQAASILPKGFEILKDYPAPLRAVISLALAEVALRDGRIADAETLLSLVEADIPAMPPARKAAWTYLSGEIKRQRGDAGGAEDAWEPLVKGVDDLYRAKAGLALTRLQMEKKTIEPAAAIDRLEGLRYAWRGDELETLVNYRLGQAYIENGEYLKGLSVYKNAATLIPSSKQAQEVKAEMSNVFQGLFMKKDFETVPPLQAISVYDEFKELTPEGEAGDVFIAALAERLVKADLLGRAASVLENQINTRLKGEKAGRTGIRLAAIRILDDKPEGALAALEKAEKAFVTPVPLSAPVPSADGKTPPAAKAPADTKPLAVPADAARQMALLKSRALADTGKIDDALAILENMGEEADAVRLRADIGWNAGRWAEAADALSTLIRQEGIAASKPLPPDQADMVLNRAIALALSNNRAGLAGMKQQFGEQMAKTQHAKVFEVITLPGQNGLAGGKEAITSLISKTDLFGEFLKSYGEGNAPPSAPVQADAKTPG